MAVYIIHRTKYLYHLTNTAVLCIIELEQLSPLRFLYKENNADLAQETVFPLGSTKKYVTHTHLNVSANAHYVRHCKLGLHVCTVTNTELRLVAGYPLLRICLHRHHRSGGRSSTVALLLYLLMAHGFINPAKKKGITSARTPNDRRSKKKTLQSEQNVISATSIPSLFCSQPSTSCCAFLFLFISRHRTPQKLLKNLSRTDTVS